MEVTSWWRTSPLSVVTMESCLTRACVCTCCGVRLIACMYAACVVACSCVPDSVLPGASLPTWAERYACSYHILAGMFHMII
jgi:hypothetical protein